MMEIIRKRVVSIDVSIVDYANALQHVITLGKRHQPSYACFSNVHMAIEAHRSVAFQQMVNNATFAFTDGMPLVFALKWLYGIRQERIAGMDFMADVLESCDRERLSVFLFGSTDEILLRLETLIKTKYPNLRLVGKISPPFRALSEHENQQYIQQINDSGAHILLVGLGCPKQETWMAQHSDQINAVVLGVGGAFGLYAGSAKRAPVWMRNVGLEWVFRLAQEPKRLFKRYAVTNTLFVWLLMKQLVRSSK
ncbi:MAG: WecB/TagA/CpsF family glycosyltransferase [Bacteroidetes bacterium]|nr:WecB/TagA/CpsF family glycosyltransferase [Bacteroidota bacterium]